MERAYKRYMSSVGGLHNLCACARARENFDDENVRRWMPHSPTRFVNNSEMMALSRWEIVENACRRYRSLDTRF